MIKQNPFQQHKETLPTQMPGRWFRRHVVIDHRHREILIQIMWDGLGELKAQEYQDIKKGAWWSLVPDGRIDEYRHAIASGYQVLPIVVAGGNDGHEHVVMQLIEITDTHHVIKDSSFQALSTE